MKGSWKVTTVANIPVRIHWTFSLLFFWIYYQGTQSGLSLSHIMSYALLLLAVFFCVVLHEYGHALTARRFGVHTQDIILSPIGGVARLEGLPKKPMQEFVVAIAGPLVNVFIAALLALLFWSFSIDFLPTLNEEPLASFSNLANFFQWLLLLNLVLAFFNLLPAFPMDGGRMLRALLAIKLGRLKATRIASFIGRMIALALLTIAIYSGDFIFGVLSLFVFVMAAQEYYMVRMEDVMLNKTLADIQQNIFTPISINAKMKEVINIFEKGVEKNFLVFDDENNLCGLLQQKAIETALEKSDLDSRVASHLSKINGAVLLDDKIKTVYQRLRNPFFSVLPIYEAGKLVGIIDLPRLDSFIRKKVRTRFAF